MSSVSEVTPFQHLLFVGGDSQNGTNQSDYLSTTETQNGHSNGSIATEISLYGGKSEYIFDRSDVRAVFLVLYTIVFCFCFFGNLVVILVITLHWRMRSITNFFLANLAFADLCVGIFCVYQNIITYLMDSWVFGAFMCKMYHFINSLSTTASVLILVVICIERYLAIIHPMTCKQMLTMNRLRITIVLVGILSAAISSPRFYYFNTISMPLPNDQYEILCLPDRTKYNSKLMDMISLTVLYLIPLAIITILYSHIGIVLWKSSKKRMPASATPSASFQSSTSNASYYRETDHNIIPTVKLTMLPVPVTSQHQEHQTHYPFLSLAPIPEMLVAQQPEKLSSSSFTSFLCLQCRSKSKTMQGKSCRKDKRTKVTLHESCRTSFPVGNRACESCADNVATKESASGAVIAGGIEPNINCTTCHYPYAHRTHYPPTDLIRTSTGGDKSITETSFSRNEPNRLGSACCMTPAIYSTSFAESWHDSGVVVRHKTASSSNVSLCCAKTGSAQTRKFFRLGRNNSQGKSVTLQTLTRQTSPSSPFCDKNLPFMLEEKNVNTEPIVVVKFEKKMKQSNKSQRKESQCTIIINTNSCHGRDSDGDTGANDAGPSTSVHSDERKKSICNIKGDDDHTNTESGFQKIPSLRLDDASIFQQKGISRGRESGVNANNKYVPIKSIGNTGFGNGSLRELHRDEVSFQKNYPFDRKVNLNEDPGISGVQKVTTARNNMERVFSAEQNFDEHYLGCNRVCGATCSSCGTSCTECLRRSSCRQHNQKAKLTSSSKLSNFVASSSHVPELPGVPVVTASSAPKRVRRMRVVRGNKYGSGALLSRRKIIRMLILLVLAFALCHLPFHGRKVWQYWSPKWAPYQAGSVFSTVFTPITFLIMFANSAVNPILYAFMSNKFRMSFKDMLKCKIKHSLRISRNASVRSTHVIASGIHAGIIRGLLQTDTLV